MRILILGGNGFIGSHLVDLILNEGHKVVVFDKYRELFRTPISGVEYIYADFGNRGLLQQAMKNIDIVVHLICTTLPKTSNDDPVFDVQSNVIESLFLFEECVKNKIKKIIFLSSGGTVYGCPQYTPIDENHNTNPICSYGITKLCIEKYLSLFNILYKLDYAIIRPSNPFGIRQNPENIQGIIPVFIKKLLEGKEIHIWGDGTIIRDYIYVTDLVEAIYAVIVKDSNSKIFNISSGAGVTINELILRIQTHLIIKPKIIYGEKRNFDIPKIILNSQKAQSELNWKPKVELDEGILNTIDFINTNFF